VSTTRASRGSQTGAIIKRRAIAAVECVGGDGDVDGQIRRPAAPAQRCCGDRGAGFGGDACRRCAELRVSVDWINNWYRLDGPFGSGSAARESRGLDEAAYQAIVTGRASAT